MENEQPMQAPQNCNKGYGKRPLWQWIVIYVVVGGLIYYGIYYFAIAKKGGYNANNANYTTSGVNQNTSLYNYNMNTANVNIPVYNFNTNTPSQNLNAPVYNYNTNVSSSTTTQNTNTAASGGSGGYGSYY